ATTAAVLLSATYRLPPVAAAPPVGAPRLGALGPPVWQEEEAKPGCPITRSAGEPLTKAATLAHARTRLLLASATYSRLGTTLRSRATARGANIPRASTRLGPL